MAIKSPFSINPPYVQPFISEVIIPKVLDDEEEEEAE